MSFFSLASHLGKQRVKRSEGALHIYLRETKLSWQRSSLFIWSSVFLKASDRLKKTIYKALIMKNVFRWHVIILINKPRFFLFGKNTTEFFLWTNRLHNCYYLYHLLIQLIKTAWFDQGFFVSLLFNYSFFFFQNFLDIVTFKKYFCFLHFLTFCQTLLLGLQMIQNNFKSTWMTLAHLNELSKWLIARPV